MAKRGRPKKPENVSEAQQAIELFISRNLPTYVKKLHELAVNGDRHALIYLFDRILGKPVERREDTSERFLVVIQQLARKVVDGVERDTPILEGAARGLPEPSAEVGIIEAQWSESQPAPRENFPSKKPRRNRGSESHSSGGR